MLNVWKVRDAAKARPAARHYSKFVDYTKLTLALLALALLVTLVVIPLYNSGEGGTRLMFSSIEKSSVTEKPVMLHLRYQGMDSQNQPFNVTADSGTQVDDDHIRLVNPQADILTKDGKWVALTAKEGYLNNKEKQINVKGSVDVFYDQGYEFTTEFMHVDVDKKTISSDEPVKAHGPTGTLDAKGGFVATQGNGRILFKGPVHMLIYTQGGE